MLGGRLLFSQGFRVSILVTLKQAGVSELIGHLQDGRVS